ncbi:MAG: M23 family metallopeptidase, partial [Nitrospiraceae bacterium]
AERLNVCVASSVKMPDVSSKLPATDTPVPRRMPSGNTFNSTPEGIRLGTGVSVAGNLLDTSGIFTLLATQTFKLSEENQLWEQELATKVRKKIDWLQREAVSQERSLEELTEAAKERWTRWGSTPSVWPVKGWVTSGFGQRIAPFTGLPAVHDGLDIGAPPNAPVHAPAGGLITAVGFDAKMGNMVAIEHGFGLETQYGHLAKAMVKQGQKVKRGDLIGLDGNTGLSTGPHLHYMIKVNERPVNPQRYILE